MCLSLRATGLRDFAPEKPSEEAMKSAKKLEFEAKYSDVNASPLDFTKIVEAKPELELITQRVSLTDTPLAETSSIAD